MTSTPHPTLIQWLLDGSDPSGCYCRICGQFTVPRFPTQGVCGESCFDEYRWREVLQEARVPYRRPEPPPGESAKARTFTRDSLVDILEADLDPDFVARVRAAVKAKREQDDEQEPPHTPNQPGERE